MTQKAFISMTATEQQQWLAEYQQFLVNDRETIEQANILTADVEKAFDRIFSLMLVFPFAKAFANDSLSARDYLRRRGPLAKYVERMTSEVKKIMGDSVAVELDNPQLLRKHVGRPSRAEAKARAIVAEKERKRKEKEHPSMFKEEEKKEEKFEPVSATVSGNALPGSKLHLDQLMFFFSGELKDKVKALRQLRNSFAEEATTAKILAEKHATAEEVAVHAKIAHTRNEEIEAIYVQCDHELQRQYVRLKEDTRYIAEIKEQKMDPLELRAILRPYWDKVEDKDAFRQNVIAEINYNDEEQAKARAEKEARKKETDNIIKYLTRKDKPATDKRISTMTERLARLEELIGKDEAEYYRPLLDAAKKENEKINADKKKAKK